MDRHETDKMKDQIEKIENIAALVDLGVTVSNRLQEVGKIFWPTMKQDIINAKLKEYETVKDFARHYSTTRSAVLTFLVGLSFGISGAFITKVKPLDTKLLITCYILSLSILLIACLFNLCLYDYLKSAWRRGRTVEEKINKILHLEEQDDRRLNFYRTRVKKNPAKEEDLPQVGGPGICLYILTGLYALFGFLGIFWLDP